MKHFYVLLTLLLSVISSYALKATNTPEKGLTLKHDITTKPVVTNLPADITLNPASILTIPNPIDDHGNVTVNNDPGKCGAIVNYGAITSPLQPLLSPSLKTQNLASGSFFPLGSTVVTWQMSIPNPFFLVVGPLLLDYEMSFVVKVTDNEPPVITCPANVTISNSPGLCTSGAFSHAATATDNCGVKSITQIVGLPSGSLYPVGTSTVTYQAIDFTKNSATCSFSITVKDDAPPVLTNCPASVTVNTDLGVCSGKATFGVPSATANCGTPTVLQTSGLVSGSSFPLGTTAVTFTASDQATPPNKSTCTFFVTVLDKQKPVLTCPANITVNTDPGLCSSVQTYVVTATDNCSPTPITPFRISGLVSGSPFFKGINVIIYGAFDGAVPANFSSCLFSITVQDKEKPVLICPVDITINSEVEMCGGHYTYVPPISATDNCAPAPPVVVQTAGLPSGSLFPVGVTTNTFTATDGAVPPNVSTCSFNVTVINTETVTSVSTYVGNACAGGVTYITANVSTNRITTYTWQKKAVGAAAFADVTAPTALVMGSSSLTFTTDLLSTANTGDQYRISFVTKCGTYFSPPATLNVIECYTTIGLRPFPVGLKDCQKTAFRELEKIYNSINGANWKRGADQSKAEAWFTADLSKWYGITLAPDSCNVLKIALQGNLKKKAPDGFEYIVGLPQNFPGTLNQIGLPALEVLNLSGNNISFQVFDYNFPKLKTLNLSNNNLSSNLPTLSLLVNLENLYLNDNHLSGPVPDFKMKNLKNLTLYHNDFIFGDLIGRDWGTSTVIYVEQSKIPTLIYQGTDLYTRTGEAPAVQTYQWYKDGIAIGGATDRFYTPTTNGIYYCIVKHNVLTVPTDPYRNLMLQSMDFNFKLPVAPDPSTGGVIVVTKNVLKVYPNPADDHVTVEFISDGDSQLILYDFLGIVRASQTISGGSVDVSISNLLAGTYIVEVTTSTGDKFRSKLVKN